MLYHYKPSELVCSQEMQIEIDDDGKIAHVRVIGGCPGNLAGISSLVRGMTPEAVIDRLEGIRCGGKPTSCPDQLAKALREIIAKRK